MTIKKELIKREIAGDCILVPVGKAIYDNNGLFALNPVAARIWDILPDVQTEEEILVALLEEYDIDRETAQQDVSDFLCELKRFGIIE